VKLSKRSLIAALVAVTAVLAFIVTANAAGPVTTGGPGDKGKGGGPFPAPAVTPIPTVAPSVLPEFIGKAAKAHPLPAPRVPQNPSLAPNPFNNAHSDTWMSDAYAYSGPLGRDLEVLSSTLAEARQNPNGRVYDCGNITFDRYGRLILACAGGGEFTLALADPVSLEVLASYPLPVATTEAGGLASAYTYQDSDNQVVVAAADNTIRVVRMTGSKAHPRFEDGPVYDVSDRMSQDDNMNGVMVDWRGRIWFAIRGAATMGVLDPATDPPTTHVLPLNDFGEEDGGQIKNSFPIDHEDAYVVTTKGMYRITADPDGEPRIVWSAQYENVGYTKPGQYSPGSGTTPTILGRGKYVAIADNADQTHVVVYRTVAKLRPGQDRVVCQVPVFKKGHGAVEDSLIGSGLSLIVENNYGSTIDFNVDPPKNTPSEPGMARVDIDPNGKGCTLVWENDEVVAPNVAPKLSTRTGLIYTITRKYDKSVVNMLPDGLDVYYWAAIDFRTGKLMWERQAGNGWRYDGYWAGSAIGPTGTAYVGQYGGLLAIRDANRCPPRPVGVGP
jgi:hypothetical protein